MNDADKLRRYQHAYVASTLGIAQAILDRHPYRVQEGYMVGKVTPIWRVFWKSRPPKNVEVQSDTDAVWTDIPSLFSTGGS